MQNRFVFELRRDLHCLKLFFSFHFGISAPTFTFHSQQSNFNSRSSLFVSLADSGCQLIQQPITGHLSDDSGFFTAAGAHCAHLLALCLEVSTQKIRITTTKPLCASLKSASEAACIACASAN